MTDPINPVPAQLAAGVRQLLIFTGGLAVGRGWIGAENVETVVGALMILFTIVYGQWRTRQAAQARAAAPGSNPSATPSSTPGDVQ